MSDDVLLFCYEPAVVCAFFRLCWILFLDLANLKGHFCFFGDNMLFACSPLSSVLATTALVRDCIELLPFSHGCTGCLSPSWEKRPCVDVSTPACLLQALFLGSFEHGHIQQLLWILPEQMLQFVFI